MIHARHQERAEQQAGGRAGRDQAGEKAAFVRGGVFARGREALHHAHQHEQDRSKQAHLLVGRQEGDHESGSGHDQDGQGKGVAAAVFVAEVTPDDAPDGTDEKGDGEHGEGAQQPGCVIVFGEENRCDDAGEIAVGGVVEPFHKVADEAGYGRFMEGGGSYLVGTVLRGVCAHDRTLLL